MESYKICLCIYSFSYLHSRRVSILEHESVFMCFSGQVIFTLWIYHIDPFIKKKPLTFVSHVWVFCLCVHLCAMCSAWSGQKMLGSFGAGARDHCELLRGCWKPSRSPLQEQHVPFTSEPPLQAHTTDLVFRWVLTTYPCLARNSLCRLTRRDLPALLPQCWD